MSLYAYKNYYSNKTKPNMYYCIYSELFRTPFMLLSSREPCTSTLKFVRPSWMINSKLTLVTWNLWLTPIQFAFMDPIQTTLMVLLILSNKLLSLRRIITSVVMWMAVWEVLWLAFSRSMKISLQLILMEWLQSLWITINLD